MKKAVRSLSTYQNSPQDTQQGYFNSPDKCQASLYSTIKHDEKMEKLEKNLIENLKNTMFNSPQKEVMRNRMKESAPNESGEKQKPIISQRKEKLMQCAEGIFQGRLNELNEYNQDYFDHIAGKCVCARCTCGKHKCNKASLKYDGKGQPNTLYNDTYNNKDLSKAKPAQAACPCDNIAIPSHLKLENHTTHRDHFTPKKGDRTASVPKKPDNIQLAYIPNNNTTQYRDDYLTRGYVPAMKFIPVSNLGVVHNAPFKGITEHKQQYNPNTLTMYSPNDRKDILNHSTGVNMGVDQSKMPNFYQSTYKNSYSPMKSSPNERKIGNQLMKISKGDSNPDGGLFNNTTTHRDHYRDRFNRVCPITIENYERTHNSKYPHSTITELDRLNMSVL